MYRMVQGPESIPRRFWSLRQPADPQPRRLGGTASPARRARMTGLASQGVTLRG